MGDLRRAKEDCDEAIRIDPQYTLAYCFRARVLAQQEKLDDALRDIDKTSQLHPYDFLHLCLVSWFLVTCPEDRLHRPERAAELVEDAIKSRPEAGCLWLILGAARYRLGDYPGALEALEESLKLSMSDHRNGAVWLFLAMTHWRLGNKQEARRWYDKAVEWMENNPSHHEEFDRFRAEAAELLGISDAPSIEKEELTDSEQRN